MFEVIQYRILKRIAPREPAQLSGAFYKGKSKLAVLFGEDLFSQVKGKVVIDFGCGEGSEAVELAQRGAAEVIGIDVQDDLLRRAKENAARLGLETRCIFSRDTTTLADMVLSMDAFEHYADPASILTKIYSLLKPGGVLLASFGPTWYHPYGGHLFSVFPWAHLVFSERALVRWRSDIRSDGARRFQDVAGGLNQMTIRRFERLLRNSPFLLAELQAVPIRKLRLIHNRLTREFTTSLVRCKLLKPQS